MRTPSVGRIVHVFADPAVNNGSDVAPAIISRVWSDSMVNVRVMADNSSNPAWLTSIHLYNDRGSAEAGAAGRIADKIPFAAFWPPNV